MSSGEPEQSLTSSRNATRGGAFTIGGQGVRLVIQLAGLAVLSRLLTPEDFGAMAIIIAIAGVGELLRDFGLSTATLQSERLTSGQRSQLWWTSTAIGAGFAVVLMALSSPIATLFGQPELTSLILVYSSTLVLNGAAAQFLASMNRELRFAPLALIDIVAQALGLALGIALAILGFGAWSLVFQQIAVSLLMLVLAVCLAGWIPSLPRRGHGMSALYGTGASLMGSQLLNYASKNVDTLLIGAWWGIAPLGYYSRAFQVMALPLNQVNAPASRVAIPYLTKLRSDSGAFLRFAIRAQRVLLVAVAVIIAFLGAASEPILLLVLGPQWSPSAPLLTLLCLGGMFQAASYSTYWVFVGGGRASAYLHFTLVARTLQVCLIVAGASLGVTQTAIAYAVGQLLVWPTSYLWASKASRINLWSLFLPSAIITTAVITSGGVVWLVGQFLDELTPLLETAVLALVYLASLSPWLLFSAVRAQVKWAVNLSMRALARSAPAPARAPMTARINHQVEPQGKGDGHDEP